jgi:predicted ATP-dependent endonuclease of OLD family
LVADILRNATIKQKYNNDLNLYTKGIVKGISISGKGVLTVESPNGPDGIWTISNGTSVLVFFITLINWVNLHKDQRSYQLPHVILLDETDSIIHPTIQSEFIEVLRSLSRKVQIFITTHSPYFLDGFSTEEIYYIKDSASIAEHSPEGVNRCNIYNYKSIIEKLSMDQQKEILEKRNSELFCEGIIENLFPISEL